MQTGSGGISGVIDTSKIEAIVAQLKAAAARAGGTQATDDEVTQTSQAAAPRTDFASVLKSSLDGVNAMQQTAAQQSKAYSLGDDSVNLSDVMISAQKANIALQTTIQVRNKLVSAYTEIMNMQV
ncbi:MAG TPA: flagellar hook-basal body complex protein FliE [Herbaspirillum sp.]